LLLSSMYLSHSRCFLLMFWCYFSYDQTQNERLNYYKANYDEMRKELYIDWEKELGDSNPIEMLNIFMDRLGRFCYLFFSLFDPFVLIV
jgi:hypothetical protein